MIRFLIAHLKIWFLVPLSALVAYLDRERTARVLEDANHQIDLNLGHPVANAAEVEALRADAAKTKLELTLVRTRNTELEDLTRQKESERQALAEQVKVAKQELLSVRDRNTELEDLARQKESERRAAGGIGRRGPRLEDKPRGPAYIKRLIGHIPEVVSAIESAETVNSCKASWDALWQQQGDLLISRYRSGAGCHGTQRSVWRLCRQ